MEMGIILMVAACCLLKVGAAMKQCMVQETLFANFQEMKVSKNHYPNLGGKVPSGRNYEDHCHVFFLPQYISLGLQDRTRFGRKWCRPLQCMAFYKPFGSVWPLCAPRRKMLQWQSGKEFLIKDMVTKINCSSLNIPEFQDGTKFTDYKYRFVLLNVENNYKPNAAEMLDLIEGLKPNWLTVSYSSHPYEFGNDSSNQPLFYNIIDRFKNVEVAVLRVASPQPALDLSKTISKMKNLRCLSVISFDLKDTEFVMNPEKLEYFSLAQITKSSYNTSFNPSWLKKAKNLQAIHYKGLHSNLVNFQNMDELESLELINIYQSHVKKVPKNFLAKSTKLKSLDLRCNMISVIETGAFDKFAELEMLLLSGNQLAIIEPPLLGSLTSLRALDLRTPFNGGSYWGIFDDIERNWENYNLCQRNLPKSRKHVVMFQNKMTVDHFKNMNNLEVLLLGRNRNATFDPEIFSYMPKLRKLRLSDMGLKDMAPLQKVLEGCCELEELVLNNNYFEKEDWLPYEWVFNTHKMTGFFVTKAKIKKASVPLALMARKSRDIMFRMEKGLVKTPLWRDKCEKNILLSLFTNIDSLDERLGLSEDCKVRYIKLRTEMVYWEKKMYDIDNVKYCKHNLNGGISLLKAYHGLVFSVTYLFIFVLKNI